jgi:hypothetical protein
LNKEHVAVQRIAAFFTARPEQPAGGSAAGAQTFQGRLYVRGASRFPETTGPGIAVKGLDLPQKKFDRLAAFLMSLRYGGDLEDFGQKPYGEVRFIMLTLCGLSQSLQ